MDKLLNRWVIMALVVVAGLISVVWRDVAEQTSDSFEDLMSADAAPPALTDDELSHGQGLRLGKTHNNVDELSIGSLRLVSAYGSHRRIAFTLHSAAPDNDYPNLEVEVSSAAGAVIRHQTFTPDEYSHGATLTTEEIQLDLELADGEARADVRPLYPRRAR